MREVGVIHKEHFLFLEAHGLENLTDPGMLSVLLRGMFALESDLGSQLRYVPDHVPMPIHGVIEPARTMALVDYQRA